MRADRVGASSVRTRSGTTGRRLEPLSGMEACWPAERGAGRDRRPEFVGHPLDVEQVQGRDVVGRDVAAVAAAAERHGRVEARGEADRAVRRRRVHHDPEGRLVQPELEDHVVVCRVDRHGVPHAAVAQHLLAALAAFAPVVDDEVGQDGAELLDRERVVATDALRAPRSGPACPGGTAMPTISAIWMAVLPTRTGLGSRCGVTSTAAQFLGVGGRQEVAAVRRQGRLQGPVDRLVGDDRIRRRAEQSVVERLAEDDVLRCLGDVG